MRTLLSLSITGYATFSRPVRHTSHAHAILASGAEAWQIDSKSYRSSLSFFRLVSSRLHLSSVHEERVPKLQFRIVIRSGERRKDVLFVSQVHERVPLALLLDVLVRPAVLLLLLLELSGLLDVEAQVDPAQEHRDEQLHGEQDHDGDLPRDVRGRVLGLEDLRADDVAHAERRQRQRVDSVLCVQGRPESEWGKRPTNGSRTFFVWPLVLLALYAYTDDSALPNVPMRYTAGTGG